MPLILDSKKSIRFQQGRKYRREEGREKGREEAFTAVVSSMLQSTNFPVEKIAAMTNVPIEFVLKIKKKVGKA